MKPTKWKPKYPKVQNPCPCGCWPDQHQVWAGGYSGMAVIVGCERAVDSWIRERERVK